MNKTLIPSLLLLLFSQLLFSQDQLGEHLPFFRQKAELYQRWLNAKGMGATLKVDKAELKMNGLELELFLSIRSTDPDSAASMWKALLDGFSKQNPKQTLGEVLFETFVRFMEIPPAQGNLQIYVPQADRPDYNPCFYVWLWEENGVVKEQSKTNNCKALDIEIPVSLPKVKKVKSGTDTRIARKEDASAIFDKILQYARQRYEVQQCENRKPRVGEEKMTDFSLKFAVTDLCQEVLTDESRSWACGAFSWAGIPCNDMRRERLEFVFNYQATEEGYVLTGRLTGKFGSGIWRPHDSEYMDMEPDFEDKYLKPYLEFDFQKKLKAFLEK